MNGGSRARAARERSARFIRDESPSL